jgi:hypothetical protein
MNGLDIDPVSGKLTIELDGRVVSTTDGTLVCLLPTLRTFSQSISFADPAKDIAYAYNARMQHAWSGGPYNVRLNEMCQSQFTRLPTESTVSQDVADAPDGADIFAGFVKLTRTVAPTHTWFDAALDTRLKTGEWMPWNGSGLVEAAVGLARALHLYIEDGKLRLKAQQSVMGAAGGYYTQPNIRWPAVNTTINRPEIRYTSAPGIPVWTSTSSPYRKTRQQTGSPMTNISGNDVDTDLRFTDGGSAPCSKVDPTNYLSTYTVDIKGYFGRRS